MDFQPVSADYEPQAEPELKRRKNGYTLLSGLKNESWYAFLKNGYCRITAGNGTIAPICIGLNTVYPDPYFSCVNCGKSCTLAGV